MNVVQFIVVVVDSGSSSMQVKLPTVFSHVWEDVQVSVFSIHSSISRHADVSGDGVVTTVFD